MRQEFSIATMKEGLKRADGNCEYCGLPFGVETPEFHHKDSSSWDNSLGNLQVIHKRCHARLTKELRPGVDRATRIKNRRLGLVSKKRKIAGRGFFKASVDIDEDKHD